MKKRVQDLVAGDIINPPAGEKVWIWKDGVKRRYRVVSVELGKKTKRGQYIKLNCVCQSPYDASREMENSCQMLATSSVTVFESDNRKSFENVVVEMTDTVTSQRVIRSIDKTAAMISGDKCWELGTRETQKAQLNRWISDRANDQHKTILRLDNWSFA